MNATPIQPTDQPTAQLVIHTVQTVQEPTPNLVPLSAEQCAKIGLELPPPVVYDDLSQLNDGKGYLGYCSSYPNYPKSNGGEVVIDIGLTRLVRTERQRARSLATTYIHEVAHRLTQDWHTPVFAAVCLCLTARYEGNLNNAISSVRFYDFAECKDEERAQAFVFVQRFATEHFASSVKAHELTALARTAWKTQMDEHLKSQANMQAQAGRNIDLMNELLLVRAELKTTYAECTELESTITQQHAQLQAQQGQSTQRLKKMQAQLRSAQERTQWLTRGYQLLAVLGALTALVL
jgi:hypothetical protein